MRINVMYFTRSGNTKKVADAIAEAVGTNAELLPPAFMPDKVDLLFLGGGAYANKPHSKVMDFIRILSSSKIKNVAVFGTSLGDDKAIKKMQSLLRQQGINVVEDSFCCLGKGLVFFARKHPTAEDLEAARNFAKDVVVKLEDE